MTEDPKWFKDLSTLPDIKATELSAQELIRFAGAPDTSDSPEQNQGSGIIGLIESSWANPLFYPVGGYLQLQGQPYLDLPTSGSESLLAAYSIARNLNADVNIEAFVLKANPDDPTAADGITLINGSHNHWAALSSLTNEELVEPKTVKYYDSTAKTKADKNTYDKRIMPTSISSTGGINEFTLDILGAHTYNQFADIAVFIVPFDSLDLSPKESLDLPDFRFAPFSRKTASSARKSLPPLVVSSSHGIASSLASKSDTHPKTTDYWPEPANLPPLYSNIDNTGLVLTMSAGDQVSGINFKDKGSKEQPLTFNSNFTSSPLLLTVGGSMLDTDAKKKVSGVKAWRDPSGKKTDGEMEGGNGGFTPAANAPSYQQASPWVTWFQQQKLKASLLKGWTQPVSDGELLDWWTSDGAPLKLKDSGFSDTIYRFYASEDRKEGLSLDPAQMRSLPDLSNIAWKDNFPSILWKDKKSEPVSIETENWTKSFEWGGDGGTSLASPATAALIVAANARRRRRGLADLSATEIHTILYQIRPGILTDVVSLQNPPDEKTSAYHAYPGFDFASGLGAVGQVNPERNSSLLDVLSEAVQPMLAQGVSSQASDLVFKPSAMPLLLQNLRGTVSSLILVSMNGFAVNAVLDEDADNPENVSRQLLGILEAAAVRTQNQLNAVEYSTRTLSSGWTAAPEDSVLRRPLADLASTEGIAVPADSLLDLQSLADIFSQGQEAGSGGMPAWYALVHVDDSGRQETLRIRPFQSNRGTLLGQGGLLSSEAGDQSTSMVLSTLQRPLLVADVARPVGSATTDAWVELELRSVAGFASLYGLYPVADALGRLRDDRGQLIAPGDPTYATLAVQAALGDGHNSLLWDVPDHSSNRFRHTQRWSAQGQATAGSPLLEALQPGVLYQHFILSSPSASARQTLITQLLESGPGTADLSHAWFAASPAANADGQGHVLGLKADGAILSLGFEDLPGLGDCDFNDVVASWRQQDLPPAGIGSLTLLDPSARRVAQLAAGSSSGSPTSVVMIDTTTGRTLQQWQPFGPDDTNGVQLGSGDVNGDGFDDLVAVRAGPATGSGANPAGEVAILLGDDSYGLATSGGNGSQPTPKVLSFSAFAAAPQGPLSLAVRDLNGDGFAEIILCPATADSTRPSLPLEVWSRASGTFGTLAGVQIPADAGLDPRHGFALAVGDLQGDGVAEVLLGDLNGADLFVGSVQPGAGRSSLQLVSGVVLEPYGKNHDGGVRPTVVSAQQTLIQRPSGLGEGDLPSLLSLPGGAKEGPTQPLLGSLGTPGAMIVQSADPAEPRPSQVPLSWLNGSTTDPLTGIPWSSTDGAPIFTSGGVSYPLPKPSDPQGSPVIGSPAPVLVAGTGGTTSVKLLTYPNSNRETGPWQITQTPSKNRMSFTDTDEQSGWRNAWTYQDSGSAPADAREKYGLVTTALVSYTPPFQVNLNPLQLSAPNSLIADVSANLDAFISDVVIPWNTLTAQGGNRGNLSSGPGTPGSSTPPYPGPGDNPYPAELPSFTPTFNPNAAAVTASTTPTEAVVQLFQQRLINIYLSSMGVDYQHHHSPLWYNPLSWTSPEDPTPQQAYVATPPGRQSQGMDCSHTSSWNYDLAFGFWLNFNISEQSRQAEATVSWLNGAIVQSETVATAVDIYGADGNASATDVITYLNSILLPGDILYLSGSNIKTHIQNNHSTDDLNQLEKDIINDSGVAKATHVITWVNDNTDPSSPFRFVTQPDNAPADLIQQQAFVIDSTGSESANFLNQSYPNGVQIRQFDDTVWYNSHITHIERWLTPANVNLIAGGLSSGG